MNDKKSKKKKFFSIFWTIIILGIFGIVAFGFIRDLNTEKIDQSVTPTVEDVKQAREEQQTAAEPNAAGVLEEQPKITGDFSGTNNYSVSGTVTVESIDGQNIIKFEDDFSSSNGPDLEVYLSKNNVEAGEGLGEFVSLKGLKSTSGAQVYSAPDNIEEFKSVVIWCRAFSVQFGAADLVD